jgi:hypothetical protein
MTIGLPVTRLVSVSITLTPQAASFANLKTLLIEGDSNVIDTFERLRPYSSITGVANDFGTTAPEYLASLEYFSQNPTPTQLYVGRWAKTATNGRLVGGPLTGLQQAMSAWTGITTGAFFTYVDGIPLNVSALNFAAQVNLNGVAAVIQTALVAAGAAGATVVWDAANSRFVITSGTTGITSSVSFLQTSRARGFATFSGNPANNDTLTIQGTLITFVTGTPVGSQVKIGVDLPTTLASLLAFLSASVDANLSLMTYSVVGSSLYIVSKATGTAGNAYTLAKVSTAITLSGGTMAGGSAGTDISAQLLGTSALASWSVAGIAAESAVASVVAMDNLTTQFYALVFAAGANNVDMADSDHLAVAAYVEASAAGGQPHVYGLTTSEATALVAGNATDIGSEIMAAGYERTFYSYSSTNAYLDASMFGKALPVDYSAQNSALTLMWKQMPGVPSEKLTVGQANALDAKRYNYTALFNNNTSILVNGTMGGPAYIDEIINLDNFANQLQTDIFNLFYTTPTKIPQTDPGVHRIVTTAEGTCQRFVLNAVFAPGQWNSNGFGTLQPGDQLPKGYYVYGPPVALQATADRSARKSPTIQIAVKEAGAIHEAILSVLVNQ